jgi:hypothetical protein
MRKEKPLQAHRSHARGRLRALATALLSALLAFTMLAATGCDGEAITLDVVDVTTPVVTGGDAVPGTEIEPVPLPQGTFEEPEPQPPVVDDVVPLPIIISDQHYVSYYASETDSIGKYYVGDKVTVADYPDTLHAYTYFDGWMAIAGLDQSKLYQPGDTFIMPGKDVEFQAVLSIVDPKFYDLTYYANWPSADKDAPVAYGGSYAYGEKATVAESFWTTGDVNEAVRPTEMLFFNGWNTKADGSGKMLLPGDTLVVDIENCDLYAQWISFGIFVPEVARAQINYHTERTGNTPEIIFDDILPAVMDMSIISTPFYHSEPGLTVKLVGYSVLDNAENANDVSDLFKVILPQEWWDGVSTPEDLAKTQKIVIEPLDPSIKLTNYSLQLNWEIGNAAFKAIPGTSVGFEVWGYVEDEWICGVK